jgi:putative oxidoreductase
MTETKSTAYGALLLRAALGAMWLSHGLLKLIVFTVPGFAGWLESKGLPGFVAAPVVFIEIAGGAALILGVYARHVALALVPVLAVAATTHLANGWVFSNAGGGWEYPLFLIVGSVALWLLGDGAYALRSRPLFFFGQAGIAGHRAGA